MLKAKTLWWLAAGLVIAFGANRLSNPPASTSVPARESNPNVSQSNHLEKATFGGGCFWCTEAVFLELKGVHSVVSGYSGGTVPNPSYEEVCSETTGHAEVIQVSFDPALVKYADLLEVFWNSHDPTTINQQGNDFGTQYRSVVFYHSDEQRRLAEEYKKRLDESGAFDRPIVTEICPYTEFYPAEDYHQDYYARNPRQGYCYMIIRPKVEKFRAVFRDKLKENR